ncbi:hypothetical protein CtCNB1_2358 [Comamonas thiooxydans]|nr:hypothetical protein CtCNB1_2358 [Comamonas thiooxydans]
MLGQQLARLRLAAAEAHIALGLQARLFAAASHGHGLAVLVGGVTNSAPRLGRGAVLLSCTLITAVDQGLEGRDQVLLAVADQIGAPHGLERLAQQRPVVRVVIAQESLVQTAALFTAHDVHALLGLVAHLAAHLGQRVAAAVVHGRGRGHGARVEGLHLIGTEAVLLEPDGQIHHVLIAGARVGGDEIGNQKLLLAGLFAELLEQLLELVIAADARLHHLGQRTLLGVLGRDLEIAAHMVLDQLLDVLWRLHRQVVAQAGTDQNLLDAGQLARAAVDLDQRTVVGVQVLADAGEDTAGLATGRFDLRALAAQAVHIGRGPAQVGDRAGKALDLVADLFELLDDGVFGTALDDAALVLGDGAEGAAAETAAHDVHRGANHLPGRNLGGALMAAAFVGIDRMRAARIRQAEDPVHFGRCERNGRRIHPHIAGRGPLAVSLYQRTGIAGVGFQVQHTIGVGIENRIALDLFVAGQTQHGALARRQLGLAAQREIGHELDGLDLGYRCAVIEAVRFRFRSIFLGAALALGLGLLAGRHIGVDMGLDLAGLVHRGGIDLEPALLRSAAKERSAAHIGDLLDRLARRDAVRHFDQGTFCIAVEQDVALAVHHDGATHLVAPVVVVGNATQRALDAAQHDGHILVGLAAALAVNDGRAVGALAGHIARGIGIVAANLAISRVTVDHRVHVAGRHAPEQIGLAQGLEGLGAGPVGLGDDAHAKALRLQHTADDGHAEAGVIHIGIARDQNDVAAVPAELIHLRTAHGQERRRTEALGPVRLVAGQRLGIAVEKGNINRGVHVDGLYMASWPIRRNNPSVYFSALSLARARSCRNRVEL